MLHKDPASEGYSEADSRPENMLVADTLSRGEQLWQPHHTVKLGTSSTGGQGVTGLLERLEQSSDRQHHEAENLYYYHLLLPTFSDVANGSALSLHPPVRQRYLSSAALPLSYQAMPQPTVVSGQDYTGMAGANTMPFESGIELTSTNAALDFVPEVGNPLIFPSDVLENYQQATYNGASHPRGGSGLTNFIIAGEDGGLGELDGLLSENWSMQSAAASGVDWNALATDDLAFLDTLLNDEYM